MCEARGPGRSAVGRPPESKNRPRHGLTAARGAESRTDGPRRARRGPNQWLPPSCAGANQGRGGCFRRVGARQKSLRDIRAIRPPAQWAAAANGRATAPAAHPRGGQGRTSSDRVCRPCARRGARPLGGRPPARVQKTPGDDTPPRGSELRRQKSAASRVLLLARSGCSRGVTRRVTGHVYRPRTGGT